MVLIDSGPPRSATAPAQLSLDRAIAAETGGGRDDEHQLWNMAQTRARYAALIVSELSRLGRSLGQIRRASAGAPDDHPHTSRKDGIESRGS